MRIFDPRRGPRAVLSALGGGVAAAVLVATVLLGTAPVAQANAAYVTPSAPDGIYPAINAPGYDISWPQCSGTSANVPPTNASNGFGIIGATDGKSYSANPCLAAELTWANGESIPATVYINTNSPSSTTAYRGDTGPAGTCSTRYSTKNDCLFYNYGANAAQYALNAAASAGAATPAIWWLDVETGNTWSRSTTANDYTIEGMVDYIHQHASATIGVYSTSSQWNQIAGSTFQPGTLAVPSGPTAGQHLGTPVTATWVPGNTSCTGAVIFPHGIEWLAQTGSATFDQDMVCY